MSVSRSSTGWRALVAILLMVQLIMLSPVVAAVTAVYGPVTAGDTLLQVANSVAKTQTLSAGQRDLLMLVVLQENPNAFSDPCNINTLREGVVLQLPALTDLKTADKSTLKAATLLTQRQYLLEQGDATAPYCQEIRALWSAPEVAVTSTAAAKSNEGETAVVAVAPEEAPLAVTE
ncbi:MAG: hypothetical protein HQL49_03865 [Gammaproteobacteria bacterium]|nr:hypothetical protein [Gammaproteobacteria bacterium]